MLTLYMIVEYELDPGGDVGEHVEGEEDHQQEGCAPTYTRCRYQQRLGLVLGLTESELDPKEKIGSRSDLTKFEVLFFFLSQLIEY